MKSFWQSLLWSFCEGDVNRAVAMAVQSSRRAERYTRKERVSGRRLIFMFSGRYAVRIEAA